jgi:hypothetical protein
MGLKNNLGIIIPIIAGTSLLLSFQNCAKVSFSAIEEMQTLELSSIKDECLDDLSLPECQPKCNFNGRPMNFGESVRAYRDSSVPFGSTCEEEVKVCSGGSLSGFYSYASCSVDAPKACLFNGQTIESGNSVTVYLNSSEPFGSSCVSEVRSCLNGQLSGSYNYASCAVDAPKSCLFNGQTVAHGNSVVAYSTSTVPYGSNCVSESIVCVNGVLSGSSTFASCAVDAPKSCTFNGTQIAHGAAVTAYQASNVKYNETCIKEDKVCTNGGLSGNYTNASCTVDTPLACNFNGVQLAHGQSVTAFESSSVEYNQSCTSQTRSCTNGVLNGNYIYSSCGPKAPLACTFNGQQYAHGQSVTAYASATVPFGSTCSSEVRTCTNGTFSGGNNFATCNESAPLDCSLSGTTVRHGTTITAYLSPSSTSGCASIYLNRTCTNGNLSGSSSYMYASCVDLSSPPPPTPSGHTCNGDRQSYRTFTCGGVSNSSYLGIEYQGCNCVGGYDASGNGIDCVPQVNTNDAAYCPDGSVGQNPVIVKVNCTCKLN